MNGNIFANIMLLSVQSLRIYIPSHLSDSLLTRSSAANVYQKNIIRMQYGTEK